MNFTSLPSALEPWLLVQHLEKCICNSLCSGWIDASRRIGRNRGSGEEMQCSAREDHFRRVSERAALVEFCARQIAKRLRLWNRQRNFSAQIATPLLTNGGLTCLSCCRPITPSRPSQSKHDSLELNHAELTRRHWKVRARLLRNRSPVQVKLMSGDSRRTRQARFRAHLARTPS